MFNDWFHGKQAERLRASSGINIVFVNGDMTII